MNNKSFVNITQKGEGINDRKGGSFDSSRVKEIRNRA